MCNFGIFKGMTAHFSMFFLKILTYNNNGSYRSQAALRVDTHKGDVIRHTVIWKFGPAALGFIWVNLERDGERDNKHYPVLMESQELSFHRK